MLKQQQITPAITSQALFLFIFFFFCYMTFDMRPEKSKKKKKVDKILMNGV